MVLGLSCAVLVSFAGVSSLVVLHHWMPCSSVWRYLFPEAGWCEKVSGKRCRLYGLALRITRERSWRLVIRGASSIVVLLVCMVPLCHFGGRCEQASGKRGQWYCFCFCCTPGRSWRLVTRGAASVDVLFVGMF